MTQIFVSNLTIIRSDNGLSPGRRQAIIWTNAGILLIGPLGTNFSEIMIDIHTFPFKSGNVVREMATILSGPLRVNQQYGCDDTNPPLIETNRFQTHSSSFLIFLWCVFVSRKTEIYVWYFAGRRPRLKLAGIFGLALIQEDPTWIVIPGSISVMLHDGYGVSNRRQLDCLFNSLCRLTTKETSKLRIYDLLGGESTAGRWISITNRQ